MPPSPRTAGPGHTVVTVICDGRDRYRSKLFDAGWLEERGLTPTAHAAGDAAFVGPANHVPRKA